MAFARRRSSPPSAASTRPNHSGALVEPLLGDPEAVQRVRDPEAVIRPVRLDGPRHGPKHVGVSLEEAVQRDAGVRPGDPGCRRLDVGEDRFRGRRIHRRLRTGLDAVHLIRPAGHPVRWTGEGGIARDGITIRRATARRFAPDLRRLPRGGRRPGTDARLGAHAPAVRPAGAVPRLPCQRASSTTRTASGWRRRMAHSPASGSPSSASTSGISRPSMSGRLTSRVASAPRSSAGSRRRQTGQPADGRARTRETRSRTPSTAGSGCSPRRRWSPCRASAEAERHRGSSTRAACRRTTSPPSTAPPRRGASGGPRILGLGVPGLHAFTVVARSAGRRLRVRPGGRGDRADRGPRSGRPRPGARSRHRRRGAARATTARVRIPGAARDAVRAPAGARLALRRRRDARPDVGAVGALGSLRDLGRGRPDLTRACRVAPATSVDSGDATIHPPPPRHPRRGRVRGPQREDRRTASSATGGTTRRRHRLDAGRPERRRVPAGPRHPDRRDARRGAGPASRARLAADRDRPDGRQAAGSLADDHPRGDRGRPRRPLGPAHVHRRRPRVRGRRGRGRHARSSTTGARPSGWRRPSAGGTARASG